tara:strand:- start:27 stop:323 length:297 start_codon:yes stop_codon:yes gene_type:complete
MTSNDLKIILELKRKKNKIKNETNNKIYRLCTKTIILYVNNNKYECIYTIPYIIFGLPKYNIEEVALFIINKLKKQGIKIIFFLYPNIIYINWYNLIN